MVAFVRDLEGAAGVFHAVCDRYAFPDPYSMYFVDVLLNLLDIRDPKEFKRFFKLCGIQAHVIQIPAPKKETQREEQSGD